MHDIDVIKRELPVDMLEFFYLTPLPGSEDHLKLVKADAPLDPDLNKYDLNHLCTTHSRMSPEEWNNAYRMAWERYYTTDHIETIMKRTAATRGNVSNALFLITWFTGSIKIEKIHPLESGLLRRRFRRARRPGYPVVSAWRFYPAYYAETISKMWQWGSLYFGLRRKYLAIRRDPHRFAYMDTALTAVTDEEEDRELFQSGAAQAYLTQQHRLERIREGEAA
jgi:hypothetical protein